MPGKNLLHIACEQGDIENVKLLLESKRFHIHSPSAMEDNTPLHFAAWNGHTNLVRILIEIFNADPNIENNFARTPLHIAAQRGHIDTAICLVNEFKVDKDRKDVLWKTLIYAATEMFNNTEMIKCLIHDLGCNPNILDKHGNGPLHVAVRKNFLDAVEVLLNKDCDDLKKKADHRIANKV